MSTCSWGVPSLGVVTERSWKDALSRRVFTCTAPSPLKNEHALVLNEVNVQRST